MKVKRRLSPTKTLTIPDQAATFSYNPAKFETIQCCSEKSVCATQRTDFVWLFRQMEGKMKAHLEDSGYVSHVEHPPNGFLTASFPSMVTGDSTLSINQPNASNKKPPFGKLHLARVLAQVRHAQVCSSRSRSTGLSP